MFFFVTLRGLRGKKDIEENTPLPVSFAIWNMTL
jgi:hypothetical protein